MVTPGTRIGKSSAEGGDPRHVHPGFGFGRRAAQNDVVNFGFIHLGMASQQVVEHGGGHVVGTGIFQRPAAGFADGCADAIDDNGFVHVNS